MPDLASFSSVVGNKQYPKSRQIVNKMKFMIRKYIVKTVYDSLSNVPTFIYLSHYSRVLNRPGFNPNGTNISILTNFYMKLTTN